MIKGLKYFFRKFFQTIDTLMAICFAIVFTFVLNHFKLFTSLNDDLVLTLIESLIGLLGLIMAFMAIIFSFNNSEKLRYFKETDSFATVMDIIVGAIVWISLGVAVLASIELFDFNLSTRLELGLFLSVCFLVVVKTGRCVWITRKLFDLSIK